MLEVYLILDHIGHHMQHRICSTRLDGCILDITMDTRLTQTDLEYIATVIAMDDAHRYTKKALIPLKKIKERMTRKIGAAEFENNVFSWVRIHPHPAIPENPVRFLGAKQITASFPLFRFFVSNPKGILPSYHRYLMNKIYETYEFDGCPLVLDFRSAKKPKHRRGGSIESPDAAPSV